MASFRPQMCIKSILSHPGPHWVSLQRWYMLIKVPDWCKLVLLYILRMVLESPWKVLDLIVINGQEPCYMFEHLPHCPSISWSLVCRVVFATDLADMRYRRRLVVYPLKMSELGHPTLMEAVGVASEFRTSYVKKRVGGSTDTMSWVGCVHPLIDWDLGGTSNDFRLVNRSDMEYVQTKFASWKTGAFPIGSAYVDLIVVQ